MKGEFEGLDGSKEEEMAEAFEREFESLRHGDVFSSVDGFKVGIETEYFLLKEDEIRKCSREQRNEVNQKLDYAEKELGGSHIELKSDPLVLESASDLLGELRPREREFKEVAESEGLRALRTGSNPFLSPEEVSVSEKEELRKVMNFHENNRTSDRKLGVEEEIATDSAKFGGLISSTQTNLEADGLDDAVEKINRSHMIAPYVILLSGNSRFIAGKDTGYNELRLPLWKYSHDIRTEESRRKGVIGKTKVGRIDSYYSNVQDLKERIKETPFVLNSEKYRRKPLKNSLSTNWRDCRLKILEKGGSRKVIVEFRVIATQPSLKMDVALHMFFLGRLAYSQEKGEELLEIEKVNKNRRKALRDGLDTSIYDTKGKKKDAREYMKKEIDKSRRGLHLKGIEPEGYLELLEQTIEEGTASDRMAEKFYTYIQHCEKREAIMKALKDIGGIL